MFGRFKCPLNESRFDMQDNADGNNFQNFISVINIVFHLFTTHKLFFQGQHFDLETFSFYPSKEKKIFLPAQSKEKVHFFPCLQVFFYIFWIIEVHNFRKNQRICLIEKLIQDIIRISPLSKSHSIQLNISEISVFTSFFYIIRIIEVHNSRTNKRICLIKDFV